MCGEMQCQHGRIEKVKEEVKYFGKFQGIHCTDRQFSELELEPIH